MPEVSFGFEVHQPLRLVRNLSPEYMRKEKNMDSFFFDRQNRDILDRVSARCYHPAGEILLEKLDEGFSCALSLSGTFIEQLERWRPDILSLFEKLAVHKNVELLGQTYYHSIAGCFEDPSEFEDQVRMHSDLMHDLFRVRPGVFHNSELTFNNRIASRVRDLGFAGVLTEGVDRILGPMSPNYLYICRDIPVFFRNVRLSDDITVRFADQKWDNYPLTASLYSSWLESSQGDVISIFLNFETFGEHLPGKSGIFDFLCLLPDEMEMKGVKPILPSAAIGKYSPVHQIEINNTISWADKGKDTSVWMGNDYQKIAFSALQKAGMFAFDKKFWRYLQSSNNFYSMSSKYGTDGENHSFFDYGDSIAAFMNYMKILAEYERRNIRLIRKKKSGKTLRSLSPDEAFHFTSPAGPIGFVAYSLDHFHDLLTVVPPDSIAYHQERGDFTGWIAGVLGDATLAKKISGLSDRFELVRIVHERKELLWKHLE